jgi:glutamate/tyrosine decarboxylase-like PLP-dependent enzyme
MPSMHTWDEGTELFAHSVIGYAIERLRLPKDPRWGSQPAAELEQRYAHAITPSGAGALEAMRLVRDVMMPACRPMDDPMNLAYVPTAPSVAATMFDLVVSASSIFGGAWEAGAGAIAAENQAIRWLADLAGFPAGAGGVFVSGGSAANLSALVTAREVARSTRTPSSRWTVAVTEEVHASVRAAARVMDVDILTVPVDAHGRLTGAALEVVLAAHDGDGVFAVVATGGTTNAGVIDELDAIADVCDARDLWLHVDGAYGLAGLCSAIARDRFRGIERADSFGVDPHKWLFAPYDCCALVYRDPAEARAAHSQHAGYLEQIDREAWNPSDHAIQLSRRARGLPLWFSLATYGTDHYAAAVEHVLATARTVAAGIRERDHLELVMDPDLSVVLFRRPGWTDEQVLAWSNHHARIGTALVVPTRWQGELVLRLCFVNPRTDPARVLKILDTLA